MPTYIATNSRTNKGGIMNRNEFIEQYTAFVKHALGLAAKARREGLLALDSGLDQKKIEERDIFEYGIKFVVDGTDPSIIEKILGNIIMQEKDEYTRCYKTIQKEAVMEIQQGFNPEILYSILNSFTDIPLNEDKIFTEVNIDDSDSHDLKIIATDKEDISILVKNNDIIEEDPELAEAIKNQTFVFEYIARLNDPAIQKVLRETDSQEIAKALKAASQAVRDKIFNNISKRAAAILKEEMEYMGPVRRSDAEAAQQGIINTIMRLKETGEIIVG
jgi:hypothetical protein